MKAESKAKVTTTAAKKKDSLKVPKASESGDDSDGGSSSVNVAPNGKRRGRKRENEKKYFDNANKKIADLK